MGGTKREWKLRASDRLAVAYRTGASLVPTYLPLPYQPACERELQLDERSYPHPKGSFTGYLLFAN